MVLAKNPFKMQEKTPPWETLYEVRVSSVFNLQIFSAASSEITFPFVDL